LAFATDSALQRLRLQPPHASLIGGDRRSSPGNSAKFTANRRASSRVSHLSPRGATQRYVRNRGRSGSARLALETMLMTPNRPSSVGSYPGPSLASCFLISGLSYKTTFNRELRISSFPLYSM
jgi:hypothetical protein